MPIENRNLKPGTKLLGRYHKQNYTCEVVERDGGKVRYRLEDGREFKSPSAAGMAITGHACDGWVFWSVETADVTPEAETKAEPQKGSSPQSGDGPAILESTDGKAYISIPAVERSEETRPLSKGIYKLPNQKGAPEGQTRYYCRQCKQSFLAPIGETPEACPQGHKAN